jgi:hypothetical protein
MMLGGLAALVFWQRRRRQQVPPEFPLRQRNDVPANFKALKFLKSTNEAGLKKVVDRWG